MWLWRGVPYRRSEYLTGKVTGWRMPNIGVDVFSCLLPTDVCQRHHQVDEASDVVCVFFTFLEKSASKNCVAVASQRGAHMGITIQRGYLPSEKRQNIKRFCLETASFYITWHACGCHISHLPMVHFFLPALALCLSACA